MPGAALTGIKILEYGTMVAGPYCAKLMADLGAEVIKLEPPEGDPARAFGPFPENKPHAEKSSLFLYNNTSKRGITLDLRTKASRDIFKKLVRWADVIIDNHAPSHMAGFGFGYATLRRINPRLVYTSITPYGQTGPRADANGDELTLVHGGGLGNLLPTRSMDISRAPVKPGGFPVGYQSAITAALVTLAAVIGRGKTGKGRMIDISEQQVILGLLRPNVSGSRYHGSRWSRVPDRPPALGRMQTSDGYLVVGAVENWHFKALRELMGNPPWCADDRWLDMTYRTNHSLEIAPQLDAWMLQQKKEDMHQKLGQKGVPLGPVNSVKDVLDSPQYAHRNYFTDVSHPEAGKMKYAGWPYAMTASPPKVSRPAPLLGQHNEEICVDVLGYTPEIYRKFVKMGTFGKGKN